MKKSAVSFTHGQNIIRNQRQLDDIAHDETIICSQLFAVKWWALGQWKGRKICVEW